MNNKIGKITSGFTLIELLVVVLIIAILAAIALPMYQQAVKKSRFAALVPIAKALNEGNEHYYLNHGNYATDPEELDITGQEEYPDETEVYLVSEEAMAYVMAYNESKLPGLKYIAFQKHSGNFAGATICEAANESAQKICEAFGGTDLEGSVTDGWTAYLLSGDVEDASLGGGTSLAAGGGTERANDVFGFIEAFSAAIAQAAADGEAFNTSRKYDWFNSQYGLSMPEYIMDRQHYVECLQYDGYCTFNMFSGDGAFVNVDFSLTTGEIINQTCSMDGVPNGSTPAFCQELAAVGL